MTRFAATMAGKLLLVVAALCGLAALAAAQCSYTFDPTEGAQRTMGESCNVTLPEDIETCYFDCRCLGGVNLTVSPQVMSACVQPASAPFGAVFVMQAVMPEADVNSTVSVDYAFGATTGTTSTPYFDLVSVNTGPVNDTTISMDYPLSVEPTEGASLYFAYAPCGVVPTVESQTAKGDEIEFELSWTQPFNLTGNPVQSLMTYELTLLNGTQRSVYKSGVPLDVTSITESLPLTCDGYTILATTVFSSPETGPMSNVTRGCTSELSASIFVATNVSAPADLEVVVSNTTLDTVSISWTQPDVVCAISEYELVITTLDDVPVATIPLVAPVNTTYEWVLPAALTAATDYGLTITAKDSRGSEAATNTTFNTGRTCTSATVYGAALGNNAFSCNLPATGAAQVCYLACECEGGAGLTSAPQLTAACVGTVARPLFNFLTIAANATTTYDLKSADPDYTKAGQVTNLETVLVASTPGEIGQADVEAMYAATTAKGQGFAAEFGMYTCDVQTIQTAGVVVTTDAQIMATWTAPWSGSGPTASLEYVFELLDAENASTIIGRASGDVTAATLLTEPKCSSERLAVVTELTMGGETVRCKDAAPVSALVALFGMPGMPSNFTLDIPMAYDEATVTWDLPYDGGCGVTNTTVTLTPQGGAPVSLTTQGAGRSVTFANLKIDKEVDYTITASATTSAGTGPTGLATINSGGGTCFLSTDSLGIDAPVRGLKCSHAPATDFFFGRCQCTGGVRESTAAPQVDYAYTPVGSAAAFTWIALAPNGVDAFYNIVSASAVPGSFSGNTSTPLNFSTPVATADGSPPGAVTATVEYALNASDASGLDFLYGYMPCAASSIVATPVGTPTAGVTPYNVSWSSPFEAKGPANWLSYDILIATGTGNTSVVHSNIPGTSTGMVENGLRQCAQYTISVLSYFYNPTTGERGPACLADDEAPLLLRTVPEPVTELTLVGVTDFRSIEVEFGAVADDGGCPAVIVAEVRDLDDAGSPPINTTVLPANATSLTFNLTAPLRRVRNYEVRLTPRSEAGDGNASSVTFNSGGGTCFFTTDPTFEAPESDGLSCVGGTDGGADQCFTQCSCYGGIDGSTALPQVNTSCAVGGNATGPYFSFVEVLLVGTEVNYTLAFGAQADQVGATAANATLGAAAGGIYRPTPFPSVDVLAAYNVSAEETAGVRVRAVSIPCDIEGPVTTVVTDLGDLKQFAMSWAEPVAAASLNAYIDYRIEVSEEGEPRPELGGTTRTANFTNATEPVCSVFAVRVVPYFVASDGTVGADCAANVRTTGFSLANPPGEVTGLEVSDVTATDVTIEWDQLINTGSCTDVTFSVKVTDETGAVVYGAASITNPEGTQATIALTEPLPGGASYIATVTASSQAGGKTGGAAFKSFSTRSKKKNSQEISTGALIGIFVAMGVLFLLVVVLLVLRKQRRGSYAPLSG